jgi:hypothetical protein
VTEELQENFTVEGVAPLSLRAINRSFDERIEAFERRLGTRFGGSICQEANPTEEGSVIWKTWYWIDGCICHFVPENWEFPSRMTVRTLWDLWFFGDRSTGIRPFKDLNLSVESQEKHSMRVSRARVVIEYCHDILLRLHLLPENVNIVSKLSVEENDRIFEEMFEHAIAKLYEGKDKPGRPLELCYGAMYNHIPKKKKEEELAKQTKLSLRTSTYFHVRPIRIHEYVLIITNQINPL